MQTGRFHKTHSGTDFRFTGGPTGVSPVGVRNRRDACPTISLTGRMPGPPLGVTLVEVLVAMVILLVGIWAVAASFPKLFGVLALEEKRTEMSRLAERTVERLKTDPYALPLAITGGPIIHPDSVPEDPDVAMGAPNSRDDILWVNGEGFVVPATQVHVFNLGLADWRVDSSASPPFDTSTQVYEVQALQSGNFDLNISSGVLSLSGFHAAELSYAWRDTAGGIHYVNGEIVDAGGTVRAKQLDPNNSIVKGSAHGVGRIYFAVSQSEGFPINPYFATQDLYGAKLMFHASDMGRRVRVDYYLSTTPARNNRLALIMAEDHDVAPGRRWVEEYGEYQYVADINLVSTGIDASQPLPGPAPGPAGRYMMAVDLNTGLIYLPEERGTYPWLEVDDYGRGEVSLHTIDDPDIAKSVMGHTFRFYYRTTDQDMITVQKAPSVFVEYAVAPPSGLEEYRTYTRNGDMLTFPPCAAGQTVAVDYTWKDTSGPNDVIRTVVGEMHTINASDYTTTLNNPNVESIIAVRGMSLKVRAWWRTQSGRLMHQDVDTILGLRPIS